MLIDTHCHLNILVERSFDVPLSDEKIAEAERFIVDASDHDVSTIINVGTSVIESINCINLAKRYRSVYATVGIHPNDLKDSWPADLKGLERYLKEKELNKIVGIGECGLDTHYEGYNLERQKNAFRAQIELALTYDLAVVVHTRKAPDETLACLEPYKNQGIRGTIHCFSEDQAFADQAIEYGFVLGLGGTITYPKNNELRAVACNTDLQHIILETDAPYLPPQSLRGKTNYPRYIQIIAKYIAELRNCSYETIAQQTTTNATQLFRL